MSMTENRRRRSQSRSRPQARKRSEKFRRIMDASRATTVEYGVMISLVAVVIIVTVGTMGQNLNDVFSSIVMCVESKLQNPGQGDPTVPNNTACKGVRGGGKGK